MHHPLGMRGLEGSADVDEDGDGEARGHQLVAAEFVGERPTEQALHDDVDAAVGHLVEVEHARDVGVLDVNLDVCLATEARDFAPVARCGAPKDFDGDLVAERHVLGGIDDADAPGADLAPDAVLAAEQRSFEIARSCPEVAAQREAALERRDPIALEDARHPVLFGAVPQVTDASSQRSAEYARQRARDGTSRKRHHPAARERRTQCPHG